MNIKIFLDQLEYENITYLDSSTEVDEINVKVESNHSKKRRRTSIYIVEMYVDVARNACDFIIKHFEGNIPDEDELNQILNEDIPRKLYEHVRALVWNLSSESGSSPIMLKNYDEVMQEQTLTSNTSDSNETTKNDNADLSTYEHPIVRRYLNLFKPINYRHPHFKKCDERFWIILQQLLFAVGKNVEVIAGKGKFPEIEFDSEDAFIYSKNKRRTISSLTFKELNVLMSYLEMKIKTEIPHEIMNMEIDKDYDDKLCNGKAISKEELYCIFNVKKDNTDTNISSFIHKTFESIAYYELQTLPYDKI